MRLPPAAEPSSALGVPPSEYEKRGAGQGFGSWWDQPENAASLYDAYGAFRGARLPGFNLI